MNILTTKGTYFARMRSGTPELSEAEGSVENIKVSILDNQHTELY